MRLSPSRGPLLGDKVCGSTSLAPAGDTPGARPPLPGAQSSGLARRRAYPVGMLVRSAFGVAMATACVIIFPLADCVGNATPLIRTCPTIAQSTTFEAAGSCGNPGQITVSVKAGLCEVDLSNGPAVGLPPQGNFDGVAEETKYLIGNGNWSLDGQSSDPSADPSTKNCDVSVADVPGALTVSCNLNLCVPSGDDNGFQCTQSSCVMHLTPVPPGSGGPDAGGGSQGDSGASDAALVEAATRDAGDAGPSGDSSAD